MGIIQDCLFQLLYNNGMLCVLIRIATTYIFSINYEGRTKSSVTNRFPWFYPRYILKCFTALEWCVE